MSDVRIKAAFTEVRDGRSPEYLICDGTINERFLAAARRLGVKSNDAKINSALINLRKQHKLKDCPTTVRKKPDPSLSHYRKAISTWTFRELLRQMREGRRADAFVVYHELPVTISRRELAAYETELIRSRKPEHNRAGRASG